MKKGESPRLDLAWWKKGKPITLKNTELDTALATYERAMDDWDKRRSDKNQIARIQALEGVNSAAKAVIKACNPKLHQETIDCLQKFPKLISDKKAGLNEEYAQLRLLQKKQFEKVLEKAAKDTEAVEKAFYDVYDPVVKKQMSMTQVGDYGLGGIDALSLLIAEMIKKGHAGKSIGDFRDNKNVGKFVDEIQDASQRMQKLGNEMQALCARLPQIQKLLDLVGGQLAEIVKHEYVESNPKLGNEFVAMANWLEKLEAEVDVCSGGVPKLDFLEISDRTAVADLQQKTTRLLKMELQAWEGQADKMTVVSKQFRSAGFDKQLASIGKLAE